MTQADLTLNLTILEDDADRERLDELTISLMRLLRELDLQSIERASGGAVKAETKGEPLTVGVIVLGLAAASVPALIALLQDWVGAQRRVVVEAPNGAKVEFTPDRKYSEEEILALMNKLGEIPTSEA